MRAESGVARPTAFLADTQSREIRALTAYEISRVDIAFAAGALIGQDHVIWQPVGIQ